MSGEPRTYPKLICEMYYYKSKASSILRDISIAKRLEDEDIKIYT